VTMTETDNVATYARIRPYNPAINEDKKLTARCLRGTQVVNQNGARQDTYNFTRAFDMSDSTETLFAAAMRPLLDFKVLEGITSVFIVYGQSGSGKSFTLIGEEGHLGLMPLSLQYLLAQDKVQRISLAAIEAYGVKATKIGFYDLVAQLALSKEKGSAFDAYTSKDNPRVHSGNAATLEVTSRNCLSVVTALQAVSHMAPTLKNPHSSRGHTVYFARVALRGLEDVHLILVDLAGSEGQTALGTRDEFVAGLQLAMSAGKLKLSKKQKRGLEQMYKTRSLEAGCINNGLTQLQSIFGELIRKKISKSQGLGLRKVLSSFISLNSAYAILFTLSASANNNKVTRATLNFAKQTQLVQVDTQRAKPKIDKDAVIAELNQLIHKLRHQMQAKDETIERLSVPSPSVPSPAARTSVFSRFDRLQRQLSQHDAEEQMWTVSDAQHMTHEHMDMSDEQLRAVFDEFDADGNGDINQSELQCALQSMSHELSAQAVEELFAEIDVNHDGGVDFDEFKLLAGKSWFLDAYSSRMRKATQRALNVADVQQWLLDDDDDDENDDDVQALRREVSALRQQNERLRALRKADAEKESAEAARALQQENTALKSSVEAMQKQRDALAQQLGTLVTHEAESTDDSNVAHEPSLLFRALQIFYSV